jgi:hypothetical protein
LPSITVIAPRQPDAEQLAGNSVPEFISAHARPSVVTGQVARWQDAVCPKTLGLSPGFNAFVSARIVAVAEVSGAPHQAVDHCKTNVQIIFTVDPEKQIAEIEKRGPALLGFHYAQSTKKIATFSHPIQGWYVTATKDDRGNIVLDQAMPLHGEQIASMSNVTSRALESGTEPAGRLDTRLATGRSSLLAHVIIIADTRKVSGYSIGSISDYLAMLVLSQTQSPDSCGQLPSILDLLVEHCSEHAKPDAVTAGDLAFLRALYSTDLEEKLSLEQADILNRMRRELSAR